MVELVAPFILEKDDGLEMFDSISKALMSIEGGDVSGGEFRWHIYDSNGLRMSLKSVRKNSEWAFLPWCTYEAAAVVYESAAYAIDELRRIVVEYINDMVAEYGDEIMRSEKILNLIKFTNNLPTSNDG